MSTYSCRNPFTSTKNKSYRFGQEIDESEYSFLRYPEQRNFNENPNYSGRATDSFISTTTTLFDTPSVDYNSSSDSSNNDSSSFDFGGGDSGGGGASGDW